MALRTIDGNDMIWYDLPLFGKSLIWTLTHREIKDRIYRTVSMSILWDSLLIRMTQKRLWETEKQADLSQHWNHKVWHRSWGGRHWSHIGTNPSIAPIWDNLERSYSCGVVWSSKILQMAVRGVSLGT